MRRILLLPLCFAAAAGAHDFWIEPASFRPALGDSVPLRLYVGQDFAGESNIYWPEGYERYVALDAAGERAIPGTPGDDPAGSFQPRQPGLAIIAYRNRAQEASFEERGKFEAYLDKEGLERVRALPEYARLMANLPLRERYSRCAKSLLLTGPAMAEADRPLGLPLELVAERNPDQLAVGAVLPVRLLYLGQPLPDALVVAFNKAAPEQKIRQRTDAQGRVQLPLRGTGVWLLTAVHLYPALPATGAQWESLWASLTFQLP